MKHLTLILLAFCTCTIVSCVPYQELVIFNEAGMLEEDSLGITNDLRLRVEPDDLLRITVHSLDPEAAAPFNIEEGQGEGSNVMNISTLELFSGYLVDREGFIDFPLLGRLNVMDLTLEDVKGIIRKKLAIYLKDPVVNARYINFKVTVLGEVALPGVLRLTNSRVTLLDALGMAGDLTAYADRSDILLIRENETTRSYEHFDLRKDDLFSSPYFYMKQNDVLYVRPTKAKTAAVPDPGQRWVSYGTAVLSLITLTIALTRN